MILDFFVILNSSLVVKKLVVEILFVSVILTGDFYGTVQVGSFFVTVYNIFPRLCWYHLFARRSQSMGFASF